MLSKIFRSTIYALIMVLGIGSMAHAQQETTTSSTKEKEMDEKMKQMELKLKAMQQKLDSIQSNEHVVRTVNGITLRKSAIAPATVFRYQTPPTAKKTPSVPNAVTVEGFSRMDAFAPGSNFAKSFEKMGSSNYTFKAEASDKHLEEQIKSGEVKEKTKTFTKTYDLNSGDKIQINNTYGKVTINVWNKKEVKVDVEMKGICTEEDEAQKLLDDISVNDSRDGGVVSFVTNIASRNRSWGTWTSNGKSYVSKSVVNYTVYMPAKNALEIVNRYGAITLPSLDGKVTINATYSSLIAKTLSNTDNDITTRYTDVNIESLNGGSLNCTYGDMVKLGTANNLTLETRYIATYIDRLKSAGSITTHYGSGLKINDLDKNLKTLNINASYAPVALDVKSGNNFDFDVTVRYANFKYDDDHTKVTSKSPSDDERHYSNTKNYKGYVGKSNNDSKVTINTSYYPVQFQ